MKPKAFCEQLGFTLEVEELPGGLRVINVMDRDRKLFKTGKREGTISVPLKVLNDHITKGYEQLQDLILEKIFN